MKQFVLSAILLIIPSLSLAGGHSGFGGIGTGITINSEVMEGKSGTLVKNTTDDVWIWDNLPEGFHKATRATCTQFLAFATGEQQPVGFSVTCLSVDPDGDATMSVLAPHDSGRALITQVAGTGKWEAYNGIQFLGGTDIQIDSSTSTYSWKPIN